MDGPVRVQEFEDPEGIEPVSPANRHRPAGPHRDWPAAPSSESPAPSAQIEHERLAPPRDAVSPGEESVPRQETRARRRGVGPTSAQVERVYLDIDQERRTTRYLHARPLLVEPVSEVEE